MGAAAAIFDAHFHSSFNFGLKEEREEKVGLVVGGGRERHSE